MLRIPWLAVAWVRSALLLAGFLPISLLGLGVREGILMILLGPYGIPGTAAVAAGLLLLTRPLVLGITGGLLEAVKAGRQIASDDIRPGGQGAQANGARGSSCDCR